MNIGEFKHRISLIGLTETTSPNGFKEKTWTELKKVWSKIEQEKRSSIVLNEKESENHTLLFTIRYQTLDLKGIRIRYREKDYEITKISDSEFERKVLVLSASEVV